MAAEFVSFTQGGRRRAFRYVDIEDVAEPESADDDQRVVLTVKGKPVRVEEPYDAVMDRLNQ